MRKVERLINLTAMLLDARRPLTAEHIRDALYEGQSDVAFRRMFERDKEELRELGLPVDRAPTDVWDVEEGYVIDRAEATVPPVDFTPDELAALWLAAGAWQGQVGGEGARRALMKLSAASEDVPAAGPAWMAPRLDLASPNLPALLQAIAGRKRVTFTYRTSGAAAAEERVVEPHRLSYRGGWYLTGFDVNRSDIRHFKLSRFEGPAQVAPGRQPQFEPPAVPAPDVPHGPWEGEVRETARVAFAPATAWWAERRTRAERAEERADGWVILDIPVADRAVFATWVLGFADEAEVVAPADLRAEIVARLKEMI